MRNPLDSFILRPQLARISVKPIEEPRPPRARGALPLTPERRRRVMFFGFWGAVLLAVLWITRSVLLPFFLALIVAYVLSPVVGWMQTRSVRGRHLPRWGAVVILYVSLVGALVAFSALGLPRLAVEIEKLARELPETIVRARDEMVPAIEARIRETIQASSEDSPAAPAGVDVVTGAGASPDLDEGVIIRPIGVAGEGGYALDLPDEGILVEPSGRGFRIVEGHASSEEQGDLTAAITQALRGMSEDTRSTATTVLRTAQSVVKAVVKGVFTFFIMLLLSAYLLITSDRVLAFFRSMWRPGKRRSFDRLVKRIDRGLSGVVRGQLLICLVNGVLSGVGFYFLGLRYWPILTLIATVLSIVPIFGAILSSVPAVIIALQMGVRTAVLTLLWILVIHQIEANLLNPKILGDAAKVHPVMVIFALLAGEALYGIAGALLAVPVLSIVQSLFLHFRETTLGVPASRSSPGFLSSPPPPPPELDPPD